MAGEYDGRSYTLFAADEWRIEFERLLQEKGIAHMVLELDHLQENATRKAAAEGKGLWEWLTPENRAALVYGIERLREALDDKYAPVHRTHVAVTASGRNLRRSV